MSEGIPVDLGVRSCPTCERTTVWTRCPCGTHTQPTGTVATRGAPDRAGSGATALTRLHLGKVPVVKGVKGLTSPGKVPEPIEKGILRASHEISVYQDGTARFDLTDLPLTHFRPAEIGTASRPSPRASATRTTGPGRRSPTPSSWSSSRRRTSSSRASCGEYLARLAQFVDDELVRLYNLDPFYRATDPRTSSATSWSRSRPTLRAASPGRLIGFTDAEACFAHPVFHAAKRRNCDGDEDSVTLLLDALLNFSRCLLPGQPRGAHGQAARPHDPARGDRGRQGGAQRRRRGPLSRSRSTGPRPSDGRRRRSSPCSTWSGTASAPTAPSRATDSRTTPPGSRGAPSARRTGTVGR